jgi:hypothetical protein
MTLALRTLLSEELTPKPNVHIVHPYGHWFSHQRLIAPLFRGVRFPDVLPRLTDRFHLSEGDFFSLLPPPASLLPEGPSVPGYAIIVTLFFIDTSLNVLHTLEHIHRLLAPGGIWLNVGPLLWTSGAQASLELSLEEVVALAENVGFSFDIVSDDNYDDQLACKARIIECEYTADTAAMMRWIYRAAFWKARKNM